MTQQEAYQVVFEFDPASGDPHALAAALEVTGPRPALGLPAIIENGPRRVREVAFAALSTASPWAVGMLVAMRDYGMPSGSFENPRVWPSEIRFEIAETLREAASTQYGDLDDLMVGLNRRLIAQELERCRAERCDWGGGWYAVPETLANPTGELTGPTLFAGSVMLLSDTGAGDVAPVTVRRFEEWVPVDGFLSDPPAFGLLSGPSVPFDGSVVGEPTVELVGWAEPGTTIRIGGQTTLVEADWWELDVEVPNGGIIEIVGESAAGASRSEQVRILHLPGMERRFGFVVSVEETTRREPALEVDFAEFFAGDAATTAARFDGVIGGDEFIENDFYIRNEIADGEIIPTAPDAVARLLDSTRRDLVAVTVPLSQLGRIMEDGAAWYDLGAGQTPFWFSVGGDGLIYQVEQVYLP